MKTHSPFPFTYVSTVALWGMLALIPGCSSDSTAGGSSGGKTSSTGGTSSQTGGSLPLAGGVKTSGGASTVTGGATSMGGALTTGGKTAGGSLSGGASTSGGGSSTGGATSGGAITGGVNATGGNSSSGGASSGGNTATGSGGVTGTGGTTGSGGATSTGGTTGPSGSGGSTQGACSVPQVITWNSTGPIITPVSDSTHKLTAVKDPSVVRFNDKWHVFASSVSTTGVYNLVYTSFTDFANASSAPLYYMDKTPGFDIYSAAPQVFYFTPQKKWYLIFQSGPPMYSTSDDISDPTKWTRPTGFYASEPAIIKQNKGWLDFWIICDASNCHLFSSDDYGRWYKSKTSVANFPSGFGDPVIVMQDPEGGRLYEASNVYKINGSNKYLALIEAYDSTSNWRRYFRSWTADSLDGPWTVLHSFGTAPFAGKQNVSFSGTAWSNDISHGEMIRAGYDEKMAIDACKIQFLYQGFDATFDTSDWSAYNKIPWKLGLLTQK